MVRPSFPPERRRSKRIVANVTPAEHAAIVGRAKACGLPLAVYVRLLLVSGLPPA
jgi:hypothetical protein